MLLEGKITVRATIQKVWDVLFNPEILLACIPGAETVEQIDEKTYNCTIKQKVGPISIKFKIKNTITKVVQPTYIEFYGEGQDITRINHIDMKSVVELRESSDGQVEICYNVNINLTGKVVMFGDRILRAKAMKMREELTRALSDKIQSLV